MRIAVEGTLGPGVGAKDMALVWIARLGTDGARDHAVEYAGATVRALSMEGLMTLCNLSIEGGARFGMVAPDETTVDYVEGRPFAPTGADWRKATDAWAGLASDEGAAFDRDITLDAAEIAPIVTWGVSPEDAAPITASAPDPETAAPDPETGAPERDARCARPHGAHARQAARRRAHRPGLHRLLHERTDRGSERRSVGSCRAAREGSGRRLARLDGREGAGRAGGAGPGLDRGRSRVGRHGLFDVRRDERGRGCARQALRLHHHATSAAGRGAARARI